MSTVLYPALVFGPVKSRRLGVSLGINLLPAARKFCTFDCVYCECGLGDMSGEKDLPDEEALRETLRARLEKMKAAGEPLDVLTFAGNGEPTLHPRFPEMLAVVRSLRDEFYPQARLSVLSNATRIALPRIREALMQVDNNILKLDSAFDETVRCMNRPWDPAFFVEDLVENLGKFKGKLIVQTMFLKGSYQGKAFDNTTEREVSAWIDCIRRIAPSRVMIYSLDREAPVESLEKIPVDTLKQIAERLRAETGIEVSVAG